MVDPLISKLNQIAAQTIKSTTPSPDLKPGTLTTSTNPSFQTTFDQTLADRMMDKMKEDYGSTQGDMNVVSAENIKVQTEGSEIQKTGGKDSQYFDMFKEMNKDLLSLDSAIETLTTPGLKVNPRQLLALQAGVANTTIMAEGFSRFTDAISRGIQTIVQTQVG